MRVSPSQFQKPQNLTRRLFRLVKPELGVEQQVAAFQMASMWFFDRIQADIIYRMEKDYVPSSRLCSLSIKDHVECGSRCGVVGWLEVSWQRLCDRQDLVTGAEAAWLGADRYAAVCRVREGAAIQLVNLKAELHFCEHCVKIETQPSLVRFPRTCRRRQQIADTGVRTLVLIRTEPAPRIPE